MSANSRSRIRARFPIRSGVTRLSHAPVIEEGGVAGTGTGGTAGVTCATCPHAQDSHDSIARRYCTATVAGGFNRRCVCVGGTTNL
ncbi:RGCVC family protein [Amycolatopsis vastitatis]|uniref:RGCVC family protein n=1 Tax=Amycolatopsis vastitatis TaxID=1905142 RepID=UPI001177B8EE|nr:RGCVC family protein [Amycolatopsis vastitatis]